MRKIKKILLVLLVLIVILGIGLCAYIFHLKPKYEGEVQLKNLQKETTVYFDDFGVPHIYGKTDADAIYGLAYAHCEDAFKLIQYNLLPAKNLLGSVLGLRTYQNSFYLDAFTGRGLIAPDSIKKDCVTGFSINLSY